MLYTHANSIKYWRSKLYQQIISVCVDFLQWNAQGWITAIESSWLVRPTRHTWMAWENASLQYRTNVFLVYHATFSIACVGISPSIGHIQESTECSGMHYLSGRINHDKARLFYRNYHSMADQHFCKDLSDLVSLFGEDVSECHNTRALSSICGCPVAENACPFVKARKSSSNHNSYSTVSWILVKLIGLHLYMGLHLRVQSQSQ